MSKSIEFLKQNICSTRHINWDTVRELDSEQIFNILPILEGSPSNNEKVLFDTYTMLDRKPCFTGSKDYTVDRIQVVFTTHLNFSPDGDFQAHKMQDIICLKDQTPFSTLHLIRWVFKDMLAYGVTYLNNIDIHSNEHLYLTVGNLIINIQPLDEEHNMVEVYLPFGGYTKDD